MIFHAWPFFAVISYQDILPTGNLKRFTERIKQKPVFKDLDPILHSQLRLAIMSLLISVKEAEFTFLKEKNIGYRR